MDLATTKYICGILWNPIAERTATKQKGTTTKTKNSLAHPLDDVAGTITVIKHNFSVDKLHNLTFIVVF